jgi:hypothetical protein
LDIFGNIVAKPVAVRTMGEAFSRCCSAPKKEDVLIVKDGPDQPERAEVQIPIPDLKNGMTLGPATGILVGKAAVEPMPLQAENGKVNPSGAQGNKQKFTFGRSESKVEEMLLRYPATLADPPAIGTYYIRDGSSAADWVDPTERKSAKIRFAETIERTVVEDPHETCIDCDGGSSALVFASSDPLTYEAIRALTAMFDRLDVDGSREISMEEAIDFWGKGFSKISAAAMFAEVDADGNGAINLDEFITFWQNVKQSGYTENEILEELQQLMEGGMWVDWKDGRCTGSA